MSKLNQSLEKRNKELIDEVKKLQSTVHDLVAENRALVLENAKLRKPVLTSLWDEEPEVAANPR